jgi:hypothetical protein
MANARATSQRDAGIHFLKCVTPLDNVYHSPEESPPQLYTGRRNESVNVALPSS